MTPTFTLRLTVVPVARFNQTETATRWVVESDDPTWARLKSSEGNVNTSAHWDWAQRWATEQVAQNSPYVVISWAEDGEHHSPVWTAELKHIRHDFRLVWADLSARVMHARTQEDADEVERRILEGENFVRLYDCDDRSVMIGLSQIQTITYQPAEVDL